jgi:hypothetical protein
MNATKAQHAYAMPELPACVIVDGPQEADEDGTPEWTVCFADDAGEIIEAKNAIWFCQSRESALSLGIALSNRYHLELVNESIHA